MWNLKKISFTNLFSHVESDYEFLNNKCVVINGENKSDRSLDNNGAGKTTLFEAITIALTNESLRNIKKDEFINRDSDDCLVDLTLINSVLRQELRIVRHFYRKRSVEVELYENGELNNQITSVAEANKRVFELIGISREDLLRYYIISQDNNYTFFTAGDVDKKAVMNRITQANMINPVLVDLDSQSRQYKSDIEKLEIEVSNYEGKVETLSEQRIYLLENKGSNDEITKLETAIVRKKADISTIDETISGYVKKLKELDKQLKAIVVGNIDELRSKREQLQKKLDDLDSVINEDKRIKKILEGDLKDTIECPKCGFEFMYQSELNLSVEDAQRLLKETTANIESNTNKHDKLSNELEEVKSKIKKQRQLEDERNELEIQQRKLEGKIKLKQEERVDLDDSIKSIQNEIKKKRDSDEDTALVKKIDADIKKHKETIKDIKDKISLMQEEYDIVRFWQYNMGKSGFMTYLANKSVKTIEGITNSYLRKFGVELSVLINGFKILKSGEVREKIDVFVTNDGITAESFMAKSGGERGRVTLAGILGIQYLINNSLNGRGLNFLALDEAISGIDSRGTMEIISTLNNCGSTVMMITQNIEDVSICSNVLRVVKENGVSKYV